MKEADIVGKFIDLSGQRFGRLTVICRAGRDKNHLLLWKCRCDCGNTIITRGQDLRRRKSQSCGCLKIESLVNRSQKHGMTGKRPYRIWKNMKTRCLNPNSPSYPDYGGRGIKICKRWRENFENFWADMGSTYQDNLEIDRINHDGNYCPENCRWASDKIQNRNTRANHFVSSPLGYMTISELSEKTGIPYSTLKVRIYKGESGKQLIRSVARG